MYLLIQFSVLALMGKLFSIIGDTSCKNFENIFNSKLHFNDLISKSPILSISHLKCIKVYH